MAVEEFTGELDAAPVVEEFTGTLDGEEPKERTWTQAAGDTAVQLAEGVNTIFGAVPNLVAPEGKAAKFFNDNAEHWREKQSAPLKTKMAAADVAISKAGEDGVLAQIGEAAGQYFSDPALAARFVTTNLPSMIPGIGSAKVVQAAALARGASAARAAQLATTAAGATNAVLNAGGARGEAFEDIKQTLIQQGMSPEDAEQTALKDSRIVAAIGGVAGYVSGKTGLEHSLVGGSGAGRAITRKLGAAASEMAGEQIEEVAPKLATNAQAGQYDQRSLGKDVGRTMVETAIGAGPGSIVSGIASSGEQESTVAPVPAEEAIGAPEQASSFTDLQEPEQAPVTLSDIEASSPSPSTPSSPDGDPQAFPDFEPLPPEPALSQPTAIPQQDAAAEAVLQRAYGDNTALVHLISTQGSGLGLGGLPETLARVAPKVAAAKDAIEASRLAKQQAEMEAAVLAESEQGSVPDSMPDVPEVNFGDMAETQQQQAQESGAPRIDFDSSAFADSLERLRGLPDGVSVLPDRNSYDNGFTGRLRVMHSGQQIGHVDFNYDHSTGDVLINKSELIDSFRGKGIAKALYAQINQSLLDNGLPPLGSDAKNLSQDALRLWQSLVRDGMATARGDGRNGYVFGKQGNQRSVADSGLGVADPAPTVADLATPEVIEVTGQDLPLDRPEPKTQLGKEARKLRERIEARKGQANGTAQVDASGDQGQGNQRSGSAGDSPDRSGVGRGTGNNAGTPSPSAGTSAFVGDGNGVNAALIRADLAKMKARQDAQNTPQQPPAPVSTPTKRAAAPIMRRNDLVGAIMRATGGRGIHSNMATTLIGDTANNATKLRGLFTNQGQQDMDDLAMLLREQENFDVRDASHLEDLVREAAAGNVATSMERQEQEKQAGAEKEYRDTIKKKAKDYGIKTVARKFDDILKDVAAREMADKQQAEDEAILEREAIQAANSEDVGDETINELAQLAAENDGRQINEEWISNEQILEAFEPSGEDRQEQATAGAGETVAAETGRSGQERSQAARPDLALEGQTPAEIRSQEAQRQAEEARANRPEPDASPRVKADQVDLFNTQSALFNSNRDATPTPPAAPAYGSKNKVFTADRAEKARELLRKKLNQLNSGLDPEMMQAGIELSGYHIEAGARKFADYSKAMIADFGEKIRPYLKSWYLAVKNYPGFDNAGMESEAELDRAAIRFDLEKMKAKKAATVKQSLTVQGDPNEFIKAPDGSTDFGEITEEQAKAMRRQAGKIRLTRGVQNSDGTGHGLAHIEANHGDQIRGAGFKSVEIFVSSIAKNFNEVLQSSGRQLLVAVSNGRKDVMFVQLEPSESGEYYRINTAFPASRDYLEKQQRKGMKLLWGGSEPASPVAGQQALYAGAPDNKSGQGAPIAQGQSSDPNIAPADDNLNTVDAAAHEAATSPKNDLPEPSQAQKEAGNYRVGKLKISGLDISIENPEGSTRSGVDPNGKAWSIKMRSHYGYLNRTEGRDGDHVDVFVKPGTAEDYAGKVFVIDQKKANGHFDEHKVMVGWATQDGAVLAYKANYAKGWDGIRAVTPMSMEQFKQWLAEGDTTEPAASWGKEKTPILKDLEKMRARAKDSPILDSKEREYVTDKRSGADLERDSQNTETQDGVGAESIQPGRDGDGGTGRPGVEGTPEDGGQRSSVGSGQDETAASGERGNLEIYTGAPGVSASTAGSRVDLGSGDSGIVGLPVEPDAAAAIAGVARSPVSLDVGKLKQNRANKTEHGSSLDEIREALPILTEGQQEDVFKAEQRFSVPDGYGMLFTNGTGTGKTFTALGTIRRSVSSGKSNILIVAPNDEIIAAWQKAGKLLGLYISRLADTNDAGRDVVITTYANMGQNNALASRDWDMVVHDEAHYLAMDKDGTNTNALKAMRAISLHPDGAFERHSMLNSEDIERLKQLDADAKMQRMSDDERNWYQAEQTQAEADKLRKALQEKQAAIKEDVTARQMENRPRVLFLSATPFAYEKTVDWANGYLFDYNEGRGDESREFRGYNAGSNRDQFMMQHFGYRMRTGKLTEPDAKVDRGLMQRQFNTWLKKKGSLSGRMLDVPADYDRKFILVDSAIGARIDEALQWFEIKRKAQQNSGLTGEAGQRIGEIMGKADPYVQALGAVRDTIAEKFDYLSRRYLLESIKAREVVPHVREHLAMGRKVVVFHDYKKGGGFNPFNIEPVSESGETDEARALAAEYNKVVAEFRSEFRDLMAHEMFRQTSPIQMFQREFPGVLLFNGDVPVKQRRANVAKFQDDASGPQVILVQSAAGKEGISLHDTTGKHQRVLFNLGQPTQPTTAIQQEGRIYRTGQVTDAIFRYLNTGTNWEKWAFATTIAQRASAAENLGMGELARALKDAFISGFEESGDHRAGMEGEGKGGKERDKAANEALTEYDRARAFYFGTQKKTSKTKAQEGADYFATPEPVGLKMAEFADIRPGEKVLEPSAGHGAIARWFPESADKTAIEPSMALRPRLAMVFDGNILDHDFEDLNVVNKYDAIVMNPPFGTGGKLAVEHLAKAATHLRDGGRVVALLPTGPAADKRFEQWMYGEEERKVNPLFEHQKFGPIYRGDTIKTRATWMTEGVVTRRDKEGRFWLKAANGESNSESMVSDGAWIAVEKTGPRTRMVRPADGLYMVSDVKLPGLTFERAGTGVMTHIVVIEKQTDASKAPNNTINRDFTGAKDINALFDHMEDMALPPRAKEQESEPEETQAKPRKEKPVVDSVAAQAAAEKAGLEIIEHTTGKGKVIRGVVRTDLTRDQAKAIDEFTFKKNNGWFIREKHLVGDGGTKFARSFDDVIGTVNLADLNAVADRFRKEFPAVPVVVLEKERLAPKSLRDDIRESGASGTVAGAFHNGTVYLIREAIRNLDHAVYVSFHEGVHAGMDKMFGKELEPIMLDIWEKNLKVQLEAKKIKDKYRYSTVKSVEEVLADMGENVRKLKGWDRFLGYIRGKLRKLGLVKEWSDKDVEYLAFRALRSLRTGRTTSIYRGTSLSSEPVAPFAGMRRELTEDDSKMTSILTLLAESDQLFQQPSVFSDTVEGVAKEIDDTYRVKKLGGSLAREKGADSLWEISVPQSKFRAAYLMEKGEKVWVDLQHLQPGIDTGNVIYGIAAGYAHNTGKKLIGDPAGLSRVAFFRRTESMISSILKYGTSNHLEPHLAQVDPVGYYAGVDELEFGQSVRAVDWEDGNTAHNLRELIYTAYRGALDYAPEIKDVYYDFARRDFVQAGSGTTPVPVADDFFTELSKRVSGKKGTPYRAGGSTLKRAALYNTLVRGAGEGGWRRIVAEAGRQLRRTGVSGPVAASGLDAELRRTFYSRTDQAPAKKPTLKEVDAKVAEILARHRKTPLGEKIIKGITQAAQIDRATVFVGGKVRQLIDHLVPESVKAGMVSDYGVPDAVTDRRDSMFGHMRRQLRETENTLARLSTLTRQESRIAYEWMNNRNADHLLEQLPEESRKILTELKQAVTEMGREAVRLGQLDADTFERHAMAYLHRSYRKWDLEAQDSEKRTRAKAIKVLGDQYKGRGMTDLPTMAAIKNLAPAWWNRKTLNGKADKQLRGEKFIRLERRSNRGEGSGVLAGLEETGQLGKLLEVHYWPAGEPLPAKYGAWHQAGTWEVRDTKGDKLVMWRDFTPEERTKMGEIDEVRFAVAKTMHKMIHDLEVGKYFEWLASDQGVPEEKLPRTAKVVEARDSLTATFGKDDWVQVPEGNIPGTKVRRYGKLAGLYVPGPVWNDIRQIANVRYNPLGETYATILKAWKISKTALSPAVHLNNIMANFVMADWHDVTWRDTADALNVLIHQKDPANKKIVELFEDAGGTQGMYVLSEIQREQLAPLVEQLRKEVGIADNEGQMGAFAILQSLLRLRFADAYEQAATTTAGRLSAKAVGKVMEVYNSEDTVFRLAAFMKAKREGASDTVAGRAARQSFLDYSINAPWVQMLRQTAFPFIAFTYRAIPMLLNTIEQKPWKLMKLGLFVGGLNMLGYVLSGGDEDKERKLLPEEKSGGVLGGVAPKLVRMPWNHEMVDRAGNKTIAPVFLDIRRFVPLGDIVDLGQTHAAVPLLPLAVPGGPLAVLAELIANRSQFTGQDITKDTDTGTEKAGKVFSHLYKAFAPNVIGLPGTYATQGVVNAGTGKTDAFGREQSLAMAGLSSVGVKLGAYPADTARMRTGFDFAKDKREIQANIMAAGREYSRKGIDKEEYESRVRNELDKLHKRSAEYAEQVQ